MPWLIRLLLCAALVGTAARADVVAVRSGEHAQFSRLVLSIPSGTDWQIGRGDQGYDLVLSGTHTFDTDRIFERIPRNRLSEVATDGARMTLVLGCECHVTAFLWRPDRLVVDVVDGVPPPDAAFEQPLQTDEPRYSEPAPPERGTGAILPLFVAAPSIIHDLIPPVANQMTELPAAEGSSALAVAATSPSELATAGRVEALESEIMQSIARAASQGLLDPGAGAAFVRSPESSQDDVVEALPPPEPLLPVVEGDGQPGISARTSVERDQAGPEQAMDNHCLDSTNFAVADWAQTIDFATEISKRQSLLTGELDAYPPGAIESLARTYVHFGFGQEALQTLALDGAQSAERRIIADMARIVDGDPVADHILNDQDGCTGAVALWSALARRDIADMTPSERTAVMMAFRALPRGLADQLAGRLAQLFLTAGDVETAAEVIAGATPAPGPEATLLAETDAEVSLALHGPQEAIEDLDNLAQADVRMTPEALMRLIELSLIEGTAVADDHLALAAAMRFEARGTPGAAPLAAAEFRARLARGDWQESRGLLEEAGPDLPADLQSGLREEFVLAAAEHMTDGDFAEFAFGDWPPAVGGAGAMALASRLLALGFPDRALAVLDDSSMQSDQEEHRLLRAEAYLSLGRAADTLETIEELDSEQALALRAEAQVALGLRHDAALSSGQEADAGDAWRNGHWQDLNDQPDELLGSAARAMQTITELPVESPPLAARAALISEAEVTRALAAELLARFAAAPSEALAGP